MKKFLLAVLICGLALGTNAQTKAKLSGPKKKQPVRTEDRSAIREAFVASCMESATAEMGDEALRPIMAQYCDCAAGKVLAKYSDKDIAGFADADEAKLAESMKPLIEECTATLQDSINTYVEEIKKKEK